MPDAPDEIDEELLRELQEIENMDPKTFQNDGIMRATEEEIDNLLGELDHIHEPANTIHDISNSPAPAKMEKVPRESYLESGTHVNDEKPLSNGGTHMINVVPKNEVRSTLTALAKEIASEQAAIEKAGRSQLRSALRIGLALHKVRSALKGKGYKAWIEDHCPFSYVTSTKYVRIAQMVMEDGFDLETFKGGIDDALGYSRKPKAQAAPKTAPAESTVSEKAEPAPAPAPSPQDLFRRDMRALKRWQAETGEVFDPVLIGGVRAIKRLCDHSGTVLPNIKALAHFAARNVRREVSEADALDALRMIASLEAPGGPLCIVQDETAPACAIKELDLTGEAAA